MNAAEEQTLRLVPRMQTLEDRKLKWPEAWLSATNCPIKDRAEKVVIVENREMAMDVQRVFPLHGNVVNQNKEVLHHCIT